MATYVYGLNFDGWISNKNYLGNFNPYPYRLFKDGKLVAKLKIKKWNIKYAQFPPYGPLFNFNPIIDPDPVFKWEPLDRTL